jgi:hypothetical protein
MRRIWLGVLVAVSVLAPGAGMAQEGGAGYRSLRRQGDHLALALPLSDVAVLSSHIRLQGHGRAAPRTSRFAVGQCRLLGKRIAWQRRDRDGRAATPPDPMQFCLGPPLLGLSYQSLGLGEMF